MTITEERLQAMRVDASWVRPDAGTAYVKFAADIVDLVAEVRRLRSERATCDGSCDIALARRQVGPDGVVPGSAKECAELWEQEASRLERERRLLTKEVERLRGIERAAVVLRRACVTHDEAMQRVNNREVADLCAALDRGTSVG